MGQFDELQGHDPAAEDKLLADEEPKADEPKVVEEVKADDPHPAAKATKKP